MEDNQQPHPSQLPPDAVNCIRRLGSAILSQDASIRALLVLIEKGRDANDVAHDRLERILVTIQTQQGEIRECLRITQSDVSEVRETTGRHALLSPDGDLSIQISGRAKISEVFGAIGRLLWRLRLLWAAGGGVAVVKVVEKVLPMIGGH